MFGANEAERLCFYFYKTYLSALQDTWDINSLKEIHLIQNAIMEVILISPDLS